MEWNGLLDFWYLLLFDLSISLDDDNEEEEEEEEEGAGGLFLAFLRFHGRWKGFSGWTTTTFTGVLRFHLGLGGLGWMVDT